MAKTVKFDFFGTLEINQSLETIQGVFIQEKEINLGKDSNLPGSRSSLQSFVETTALPCHTAVRS